MSKYQILHEKRSYFIKKHRTSRERKPNRRKKKILGLTWSN